MRLVDVYNELSNYNFIQHPMLIRHYNDEYILVHIISYNSVSVCKISYSEETSTFTTMITNFQKDGTESYSGDPIEIIINEFISSNELDEIDCDALSRAIHTHDIQMSHDKDGVYIIRCKSFNIEIEVENDMFEAKLCSETYHSPIYRFENGFDLFKFICFLKYQAIKIDFNEANSNLLTIATELYLEFGNNVVLLPGIGTEVSGVKLQEEDGYMFFSIDTLTNTTIRCKVDRYDDKFYCECSSDSYEDILDFAFKNIDFIKEKEC